MKTKGQNRSIPIKKPKTTQSSNRRIVKKHQTQNLVAQRSYQNYNGKRNESANETRNAYSKLPQVSSTNWCLYDVQTDKFIGYRQNHQRQVASLTKIMTTIVAIDLIQRYGMDRDVLIKVSKTAVQANGTSAQLRPSTWVKVGDLLYGAMLPSGNDAAYLLAQVFGLLLFYQKMKPEEKQYQDIQSVDISLYENTQPFISRFLKQMNRKAKQLKLYRTSFANPHGLGNVLNYSSASDILILSGHASENREFKKIMNTTQYQCEYISQNLQDIVEVKLWKNTNKLLWKGWQGIKTGQTNAAGSCLASMRENIYIIVLNCSTMEARFEQTETIYNWYKNIINK